MDVESRRRLFAKWWADPGNPELEKNEAKARPSNRTSVAYRA
jgi:hypothetical protein